MHAADTSLETFLRGQRQFVVPSFQHSYQWELSRWEAFIEGVLALHGEHDPREFFLGAIVIMPAGSAPRGMEKHLLVDGHRRLTTVLAMIAGLRDLVALENSSLARRMTTTCLINPKQGLSYRYKLLPIPADRDIFFRALEGGEVPSPHPATADTSEIIRRVCRDLAALERLYRLLMRQLRVVRIVLDTNENPYPILKSLQMPDEPFARPALSPFHLFGSDPALMALIAEGESQTLEFKESVCQRRDKENVSCHGDPIVRSVASFMNSETGGTLLLGVRDDGSVRGLNEDYRVVDAGKGNWDGFQLFLANLLRSRLDIEAPFQFYTITRHTVEGRELCRIDVRPASQAVYVEKRLYVRAANQTLELRGPDLIEYVRGRWGFGAVAG